MMELDHMKDEHFKEHDLISQMCVLTKTKASQVIDMIKSEKPKAPISTTKGGVIEFTFELDRRDQSLLNDVNRRLDSLEIGHSRWERLWQDKTTRLHHNETILNTASNVDLNEQSIVRIEETLIRMHRNLNSNPDYHTLQQIEYDLMQIESILPVRSDSFYSAKPY